MPQQDDPIRAIIDRARNLNWAVAFGTVRDGGTTGGEVSVFAINEASPQPQVVSLGHGVTADEAAAMALPILESLADRQGLTG